MSRHASTRMIIGLCGLQGAGKDTVANFLIRNHGFKKLSFASKLKDIVATLFGWDRNLLEGTTPESRAWREQEDVWWAGRLGKPGYSPRRALQEIGTDILRDVWHSDVWMLALERQLEGPDRIVVTDCRFPNDIEMLRSQGATIVHVVRGSLPDWFVEAQRGESPDPVAHHPSEWLWCRTPFDAVLENNGTLETLEVATQKLLGRCE